MQVELLNQYSAEIDIDGETFIYTYRTKKTLDELKNDDEFAGFDDIPKDAKWQLDKSGFFIYAQAMMNEQGDYNTVRDFNRGIIGKWQYYTLDELKGYDLVYLGNCGDIDSLDKLETNYKETVANMIASPLSSVYSSSEAEKEWGLKDGTIRASCTRGKLKKHIGSNVKQSGKSWIVTDYIMKKEYGKLLKTIDISRLRDII